MKLELQGMTKRFGPVVANDNISLVVEPGQIHALLGENGAGKTEIMYSANMSYAQIQKYLGFLLSHGFINRV